MARRSTSTCSSRATPPSTWAAGACRSPRPPHIPGTGASSSALEPDSPRSFELRVRVPGWTRGQPVPSDLYRYLDADGHAPTLKVNGQPIAPRARRRVCRRGADLATGRHRDPRAADGPVRRVVANERVEEDRGKVALERGPLVYCAEGIDNEGRSWASSSLTAPASRDRVPTSSEASPSCAAPERRAAGRAGGHSVLCVVTSGTGRDGRLADARARCVGPRERRPCACRPEPVGTSWPRRSPWLRPSSASCSADRRSSGRRRRVEREARALGLSVTIGDVRLSPWLSIELGDVVVEKPGRVRLLSRSVVVGPRLSPLGPPRPRGPRRDRAGPRGSARGGPAGDRAAIGSSSRAPATGASRS